ncbi:MAG: tripartite tricarboxylate transporter TctB family protein [Pseudomonadota bacterium]
MKERKIHIDWAEAIVPGIALFFGVAFFYQTTDAPKDALFWPLITAGTTLVLWFLALKRFVVQRRCEDTGPSPLAATPAVTSYRTKARIALILSAAVGYLVLIPFLGFSVTNFLFMLVVFRGLGSRRWGQNMAVAAGIAIFLHVALVVLMMQELPRLVIGSFTL